MNATTVKLGQNTIFVSIAFYCCLNDQLGCNKFIYDYLFLVSDRSGIYHQHRLEWFAWKKYNISTQIESRFMTKKPNQYIPLLNLFF